ncbi:MAG: undecaprenyldiphospho-muramoylpentapeptide beta-N-acetylglucosaminyltransferase [Clostridiales Family XIII bacterium]|jgi:UDP-N-acetylglucosamine--N-acetylmuramyl-(pentapeptide) pyrophosphoryl-undecaprenol N-acetylglucosamine transferase|nr:undecaprenyldiphospho-muramoylpentapeptide beta-N-acetylglucosaminyltransferase [Clostridiales Family XIII bacterium]
MKVLLAGSATGGHLYPALAIADKIKRKKPDTEFLFVGAKREVGSEIIENSGYRLARIDIRGVNRRNLLKNFSVVKDLVKASGQIRGILNAFQPDFVIGTGGYACGPVIREAKKKGIRTYLHEQNIIPGLANKLAEKYADRIFVAFSESRELFKQPSKVVVSGNPVRRAFLTAGAMNYREKLGIGPKEMVLLIFGGSQGADYINEVVSDMLIHLDNDNEFTVFFITGKRMFYSILQKFSDANALQNERIHVMEYSEAIHEYFSAADLIISRSGALTISEIAVCGKPSILIPSPNVTGNHQYFNAKTLADKGAAIIIEEGNLTSETLKAELLRLCSEKERLNQMATAAAEAGRPDAVDVIYAEIMEGFR